MKALSMFGPVSIEGDYYIRRASASFLLVIRRTVRNIHTGLWVLCRIRVGLVSEPSLSDPDPLVTDIKVVY